MVETASLRVLGISGSLRRASYNTATLRAAAEVMPDDMGLEIAEIGDLPHFNADDEQEHGFPASVVRLRDQIAAADALLVATPEYNFSITGVLKNAIDWASRPPRSPLNLKPSAVLGAGGRLGTARAQAHFRDIALHSDLRMVQKPEVLISDPWDKFEAGRLIDERTRDQIRRLVLALRGLTLRIKATRRRVLVVGRHPPSMRRVTTELRELGYEPVGVADDESALELLNPGSFAAVLIGGGVEDASRVTLAAYVTRHAPSTAVVEVDSPDALHAALEGALELR